MCLSSSGYVAMLYSCIPLPVFSSLRFSNVKHTGDR